MVIGSVNVCSMLLDIAVQFQKVYFTELLFQEKCIEIFIDLHLQYTLVLCHFYFDHSVGCIGISNFYFSDE